MAKTSMVNREHKRTKLVKRYAARRAKLKEIIRKPTSSPAEREAAVAALQALPRDSSKSRVDYITKEAQALRNHWPLAR